jgi:hypothetical protein
LLVTGALAFLLGFSGRAATSMGASMCGRGAESVMYASVGSSAVNATKGAQLYPFAGAFCFILSVITPILMRFSDRIYHGISRVLPKYAKHGGAVISRTLGKIVLPAPLRLYKRGRRGQRPASSRLVRSGRRTDRVDILHDRDGAAPNRQDH